MLDGKRKFGGVVVVGFGWVDGFGSELGTEAEALGEAGWRNAEMDGCRGGEEWRGGGVEEWRSTWNETEMMRWEGEVGVVVWCRVWEYEDKCRIEL